VEVLAKLTLLLVGQVHPVAAGGALGRSEFTGQTVDSTLGAVVLLYVPEVAVHTAHRVLRLRRLVKQRHVKAADVVHVVF